MSSTFVAQPQRCAKLGIAFASFCFLLALASAARACSAFVLQGDNYRVIGFNENWRHLPGMAVLNKRGTEKHNMSWNRLIGQPEPTPELRWKAKYGSLTFTTLGIDLPCYGMNEAGLFVVELYLDHTRSLPDTTKPRLFWAQWIQFQLDNYGSVAEVIRHLPEAPIIDWWPGFPGSHLFVADSEGNTAAIEFIDDKLVVSTGATMPIPALCNGQYAQDVAALSSYQAFGGSTPYDFAADARTQPKRFARVAHRLKEYRPELKAPMEYAWQVLGEVRPGTWQLVADVRQRTIYFRTLACDRIKSIDLKRCDFSAASPARYIDLHLDIAGDVTERMEEWTAGINRGYVRAGFPGAYPRPEFFLGDGYKRLKANLDSYADDLQRQFDATRPKSGT